MPTGRDLDSIFSLTQLFDSQNQDSDVAANMWERSALIFFICVLESSSYYIRF